MTIIAIDPGTTESAILVFDGVIRSHSFESNDHLIKQLPCFPVGFPNSLLVIEMVASYGMPVGREVFETVLWIGRFFQRWVQSTGRAPQLVYRKDIKTHLCGSVRAKDANIRQALIDKLGPQGKKAAPGPTYGISKHAWAALAVAVYAHETLSAGQCGDRPKLANRAGAPAESKLEGGA